jgi:hypothetical protein
LVLYADSHQFNFFAEDSRTLAVIDMCFGFCRLIDHIEDHPFPNLRNFPFEAGIDVEGTSTLYRRVQEVFEQRVPRFERVRSFNLEASIA